MVTLIFFASIDFLVLLFRNPTLLAPDYPAELIIKAVHSNIVVTFLPIIAALPVAGNYVDDIKSKYVRYILIRTDCTKYLASRILMCCLSGGAVVVTGILLAWGGVALLLLPMEKVAEVFSEAPATLLRTIILAFLNSGLWALVGMTMSTIMESQYVAHASPFVIYYLLVILYDRYLPNAFLLSPSNWTDPDVWPLDTFGATLFLLELNAICGIVFFIRAGKRLREL